MLNKKIDNDKLLENIKKLLSPDTPSGLKMLAIKGMIPLKPSDYVIFLYQMLFDESEEIRELASKNFMLLPEKIIMAVILQPLPSEVLHRLAIEYRSKRNIIEKLLMNNSVADETFEVIASFADEGLVDIIARNQVRILRYPGIIKSIYNNRNASVSQKNMVIEFARKSGIDIKTLGLSIESATVEKSLNDSTKTVAAEEIKKGSDNKKIEVEVKENNTEKSQPSVVSSNKEELVKKYNIEKEFYDESIPLPENMEKGLIESLEKMEEERQMAFVEVGRHRVKQIMAKSPNSKVALAAVKHPEVNQDDIFKIAQDRSANADAIKYISANRDYIRVYNIKLKLALNPKTPVPIAMAFVRSLRLSDLKNIAKNNSVSKILQNTAKGIMKMHS